jgi:chemosensory pili system protein ChpA (sensor histidine kinase/response regulator)
MTVLVVEDDPAVLRGHTKLLEQGGFDVLPAVNGMEAFDRLRGSVPIHAILCDVDMPTLNGTGFFEQLEEILPEMAGRVVFVTGHADEPEIRKFLEQTGQPFLGKPIHKDQLVDAVRQIVERRGSGGFATMRGTE